jgi:cytochrome oxidase assembly protein ShyY1
VSWRFLRISKWVVRHVLVAALVAAMVAAGFWQLRRLADRQDRNDLVEARQEAPARPFGELVPPGAGPDDPRGEGALHRRATAVGTYLDEATVVVVNRSHNGASGGWVLTPLDLGGGTAVLVNRGFIGLTREGRVEAPPAPPGEVRVEGLVQDSQARGRFGPRDAEEGTLSTLARVDVPRIDAQVAAELLPAYLQRLESDPPEPAAAAGAPQLVALPAPELSDGPHLAYAVQWFVFTTIALVGYPLLLRRVARDEHRERARAAQAADEPRAPERAAAG